MISDLLAYDDFGADSLLLHFGPILERRVALTES
jgi:hypothetical protein